MRNGRPRRALGALLALVLGPFAAPGLSAEPLAGPWLRFDAEQSAQVWVDWAQANDDLTLAGRLELDPRLEGPFTPAGSLPAARAAQRPLYRPGTAGTVFSLDLSAAAQSLPGPAGARAFRYRHIDGSGTVTGPFTVRLPDPAAPELALLVLADMQDGGAQTPPRRWAEVAQAALAKARTEDVRALVLLGDLVQDDTYAYWLTFFRLGQELLASIPAVAVPGNHDTPGSGFHTDTSGFLAWYPGPLPRRWALGPVAWILLNTEVLQRGGLDEDTAQGSFTRSVLAAEADRPWRFIGLHVPPIHALNRHQSVVDQVQGAEAWWAGRADAVFAGHVHAYQRFGPRPSPEGLRPPVIVVPPAGNFPEPYSRLDPPTEEADQALVWPPRGPDGRRRPPTSGVGFVFLRLSEKKLQGEAWSLGNLERALPEPLLYERWEQNR